ncbi:MAG: N-acetylmuramic acid 6-phosphate etherase [Acholeplasmatales bacterium]|jgi:N-acetylmuramic acid 6-phosphate etherase|nr:N-acetylmuramic acid 6-phosphate etherase [Acholeplasmataceae bacterium]MDY0115839.1 N-acetylmuramic acid 6-phosphate etherase [Acholeplasmatales bacterium]MCK9234392.1 N-acetylmuramic acid 6-phosphate etherase [Acholeplasmataceae bacterium]MCK9289558.1 N-acetylmuramic acid 6-phosphate etherase [Acholeplasmataceae bacterium]MCK9427610.1 N-acetylmuramic acid 6-phosphate etherase [Acholeplasmataceae bacterium]
MIDISKITTEKRNDLTKNIDFLSTKEIIKIINKEDEKVTQAVKIALPQIELVINEVVNAFENDGRLVYIGAGTSGRIGVLDASECPPTFGVPEEMVVGIIAGGDYALRHAVENAEDLIAEAITDLKEINLSKKDVLIGLTASGRTPYVATALKYANELEATTAVITTSENSEVAKIAKYPIEAITGPEVLTGSTRMKSGTAQKIIANMITTTAMIKIGKVYENLMIDVQMTNEKLVSRAKKIVRDITGVNNAVASEYINKFKSVKYAIFAIMAEIEDEAEIKRILEANNGNIRQSLKQIKGGL